MVRIRVRVRVNVRVRVRVRVSDIIAKGGEDEHNISSTSIP